MYIPCFLQVVFHILKKYKIRNQKIKKRVKSPKRKIKGHKKYRPQKKNMRIRPESEQVQIPLLLTFLKNK